MTAMSRRAFLGSAAGAAFCGLTGMAGCAHQRGNLPAGVTLSPATWGEGVLEGHFAQDDTPYWDERMLTRHPLAHARHGIIAGTTGKSAIHAGLVALELGGSAIDAALTTALTQICLAGGAWVSYAGFAQIVYYEAATGRIHNLNAAFNTVANEKDPTTIPAGDLSALNAPLPSGRTALVPGFMAGVEAAHQRWGRLPFESLFEPAIYFAENGFPMGNLLAAMLGSKHEVLSRLPATREVYTKSNGEFYVAGDTFVQPKLAATLRACAEQGIQRYFYEGDWAEKFVAAVRADGGHMTMDDMRNYRVMWPEALATRYAGFDVYTIGLPAYGGAHVLQALNLMDVMGVRKHGHYGQSPEALFWMIQAGTALRTRIFWSMDSKKVPGVDVSLAARSRKDTAEALWRAARSGQIPDALVPAGAPSTHSDAIAVVDRQGNVVAMTHTINTSPWGSTGINIDGISIPDSARFQQRHVEFAGPGRRLPDPTSPLIVMRGGKPVFAIGSIGEGLHFKTICALSSLLDFGMDPKRAIDTGALMDSFTIDVQAVGEGEFDPGLLKSVETLGQRFRVLSGSAVSGGRGYLVVAGIDPRTGELSAAAPGEFLGGAEGY